MNGRGHCDFTFIAFCNPAKAGRFGADAKMTSLLNLLVLRVPDLERASDFYSAFGLTFTKHAHGQGPEHYAAEFGGMVFELYPQASEDASTKHVRIGFRVADAAAIIQALETKGGKIISPLQDSPWGLRAVVSDPFGHRIELTESA